MSSNINNTTSHTSENATHHEHVPMQIDYLTRPFVPIEITRRNPEPRVDLLFDIYTDDSETSGSDTSDTTETSEPDLPIWARSLYDTFARLDLMLNEIRRDMENMATRVENLNLRVQRLGQENAAETWADEDTWGVQWPLRHVGADTENINPHPASPADEVQWNTPARRTRRFLRRGAGLKDMTASQMNILGNICNPPSL
ncbi:hypothetical protein L228DRAFT_269886 [Xylona heveae TC161]|uniref:Uncharacterized protein n=1 Tax=Xylona heveae (strain CBS 132557 / TC161) TaxID=1328760 RepID=A0A165AJI5_XYLHT|nr:hypothetical protein L228DRAFT_269886 [Xylona heveae TC161]KZF20583.1 hypothetical protein L228DRAFT_269886 [Xylona heveae TC161]